MENSIVITKKDEGTIITLKGLLDNELAANLSNVIEQTTPPVILDMQQVPYVSTLGSLSILNFYNQHKQKPAIQGANANVISMLELSGTARYVEITSSSDELSQSEQE